MVMNTRVNPHKSMHRNRKSRHHPRNFAS
jgi:hypothetical protein